METATFQRSTSKAYPDAHTIAITMGEGDIRELSIYDAQDLYESLGMALAEAVDYMESRK